MAANTGVPSSSRPTTPSPRRRSGCTHPPVDSSPRRASAFPSPTSTRAPLTPAWEVSTILIGLLSFMTSEEMTTGSVSASEAERKYHASRSRWWNSTGGGSHVKSGGPAQKGNVKAGDGGAKFKSEWPEVDAENWEWMTEHKIDTATGQRTGPNNGTNCGPQLGIAAGSGHQAHAVVDAVMQQRDAGRGWLFRNKLVLAGAIIFVYVLIARLLGGDA